MSSTESVEQGTGPIMTGFSPIMTNVSWHSVSIVQTIKETAMNVLSYLHTTIEQTLAICSPLGFIIVRKNYDRTSAAFTGVGPV